MTKSSLIFNLSPSRGGGIIGKSPLHFITRKLKRNLEPLILSSWQKFVNDILEHAKAAAFQKQKLS
jgi:hypothetical protein